MAKSTGPRERKRRTSTGWSPVNRRTIGVDLFTTGQLAKLWGMAPRTICKLIDTGQLKGYRMPDRRVCRAEAERFARELGLPFDSELRRQVILAGIDTPFANGDPCLDIVRATTLIEALVAIDQKAELAVLVLSAALGRTDILVAGTALRCRYPRVRLVAVTLDDEVRPVAFAQAGFDAILLHPVSPEALAEAVHRALER